LSSPKLSALALVVYDLKERIGKSSSSSLYTFFLAAANAVPTKLLGSKRDEVMAMVNRATVALLLSIIIYGNFAFLRSMK
jgi:hypothetical protein